MSKMPMVNLCFLTNTYRYTINLFTKKYDKFFGKSIYFWLAFESYCLHGHAQNDSKCSYILFLIKYKTRNIMKTEQTTIVYAQWDRWTSHDVIKHHMITTDVTLK